MFFGNYATHPFEIWFVHASVLSDTLYIAYGWIYPEFSEKFWSIIFPGIFPEFSGRTENFVVTVSLGTSININAIKKMI